MTLVSQFECTHESEGIPRKFISRNVEISLVRAVLGLRSYRCFPIQPRFLNQMKIVSATPAMRAIAEG